MPRECSICTHPDRVQIEAQLNGGEALAQVAKAWSLSKASLWRHAQHVLADNPERAAEESLNRAVARSVGEVTSAADIITELRTVFRRVQTLYDAIDEALRDPVDPARYTLDPRAREITVVWEEAEDTGERVVWRKRRSTLQELLDRAAGLGRMVSLAWKTADPRVLLLQTADRLQGQLELIAKLIGELEASPALALQVAPEWVELRGALLRALSPHPEARDAVVAVLAARGGHGAA